MITFLYADLYKNMKSTDKGNTVWMGRPYNAVSTGQLQKVRDGGQMSKKW
jgi:hypothetical protein